LSAADDASTAKRGERDPSREVADRLPITDRPSWLVLLGLILLVLAGITWAAFGRTPDAITGPGMVVPEDGFVEVGAELQGTVMDIDVSPGDAVAAGAVVAHIRTEYDETVTVTCPVTGTVATVLVRAGGVTNRGTALLTVEPKGSRVVVVAFVPAGPGKRIAVGMPARISLASAPRSQFGTLVGLVEAVSPVPVSPERVILIVGGNLSLADYFLTGGPILEVTVAPERDPTTPSGYRWTTGAGPPTAVSFGTLAEVAVIVSEAAPLQRILK
jgi:multidrug efflux pump subunit AcrA (membrane-fusion protein)